MAYSPSCITIGFYFDKFRGLASGISSAVAAVGILSGSLTAQTLIDTYGVSGAFLLIGAVSFHYSLFSMFYRPTPYEGGADWEEEGGGSSGRVLSVEDGVDGEGKWLTDFHDVIFVDLL
jgi:hypothetical protein